MNGRAGNRRRSKKTKPHGIPICEIWPGAKEAAKASAEAAEKSRQDERFFGQCEPAYVILSPQ